MKVVAALVAFWFTASIAVIVFMLGDDTPDCTPKPTGPAATATADPSPVAAASVAPGSRVWPVEAGKYEISDVFGSRGGEHRGVDLAAPQGTLIYAAADGLVVEAGPASGFGQWIVLDHNIGGPVGTVYGHMYPGDLLVAGGDQVTAGQPIARVGSNGQSSGPHLHFEVYVEGGRLSGGRAIDPVPWLSGATTTSGGDAGTPAAPAPECTTPGGGVDNLQSGLVPPEFEPWYRRAGTICPQITSSLLAAQGLQEGGFDSEGRPNVMAVSVTNAQGPSQFMPGTWQTWGEPVDDAGNAIGPAGTGNINKPSDAIMAQGRFMCHIARSIDAWIEEGKVIWTGDRRVLYLAGYNAGEGAVLRSGGFPEGHSDYVNQTRPYADNILAMEPRFRALAA